MVHNNNDEYLDQIVIKAKREFAPPPLVEATYESGSYAMYNVTNISTGFWDLTFKKVKSTRGRITDALAEALNFDDDPDVDVLTDDLMDIVEGRDIK